MKGLTYAALALVGLLIAAGTVLAVLHDGTPAWFELVLGLAAGHSTTMAALTASTSAGAPAAPATPSVPSARAG